ncbi:MULTISPECIES: response regulator [Methylobacterium]|jgi:CheY-like chemotaxis protein|uniref:CheY-like chemotaxis protein n=1 Tax=Methylobacterium radiotolerans TaxID=31998 RepID=A0ABV2NTK6_9HYPH|nr:MULTISPECIES: response regulator [Methylobacterium]MBP2506296.1 CheY-like chemotaxis protein [Methylobacterium sp. PvP109]MDH2313280.1 response regulator [Methylobacterium brachiatum]
MSPPAASPPVVALVAEDEFLIRMEAADTLAEAGFTVLEVGSADAALRFLEDQDGIDLLFTDVNMPGNLTGFDLAREVAARWPEIIIIVCSGATKPQPGDLPAKARFIDKPYSPALVQQVLRELRAA